MSTAISLTEQLAAQPAATSPAAQPRVPLWRGVLLRFAFVYWGLYCLLICLANTLGFDWLTDPASRAITSFGAWLARHVLGVTRELSDAPNGSGDKVADWVLQLGILSLAVIATVVWSALDRRRAHDATLRAALRVVVRYTLAYTVLGYGLIKVFFGQFPPPSPGRLLQSFGDASPMGLLWTFMGASPAYVFFSGAVETLGAGLLLVRRTTLAGALLLASVMTNVAMLNLCYDVPVKLASSHYLAMAIWLLWPDLGRIAGALLSRGAVAPAPSTRAPSTRRMRWARRILKYGVTAVVLVATLRFAATNHSSPAEPKTWYGGIWAVTSFHRDGREVPASRTEPGRWNRLRFQSSGPNLWLRWRFVDGRTMGDLYDVAIDEPARTFKLSFNKEQNDGKQPGPGLATVELRYTRIDDQHLRIEGKVGADELSVLLEHVDPSSMLLVTRGFHWISEEPFNR